MLELHAKPVLHGPASQRFRTVTAAAHRKVAATAGYPLPSMLRGEVLLPMDSDRASGPVVQAIADGNRSAIVPDATVDVGGRGYALSIKGVGAVAPLYGDSPLEFAFRSDFRAGRQGSALAGSRQLSSEAWLGEAPYGGQGELSSSFSLELTGQSDACQINGFFLCPTIEVNEFPADVVAEARGRFWYRRFEGRFVQEQRLVPSNIRLYHESEVSLGRAPQAALQALGVADLDSLDAFIERFAASGVAALTLYARTLRETAWGLRGLDYRGVYLDKDAVLAADGTLHFADTEGLDWTLGGADISVEQRIREQFSYNFYEFMYALDALLRERERMAGRPLHQEDRRASAAARLEMALAADPFAKCEADGRKLNIVVRPAARRAGEVTICALDLR